MSTNEDSQRNNGEVEDRDDEMAELFRDETHEEIVDEEPEGEDLFGDDMLRLVWLLIIWKQYLMLHFQRLSCTARA
jgi:hypothetical protein